MFELNSGREFLKVLEIFEFINWRPGIGDPSVIGWATVFTYAIACVLSYRVYILGDRIFIIMQNKQKRLWLSISLVMLLLCLNKQLDLQSLFTDIGRYFFQKFELYQARRKYQLLFVVSILTVSMSSVLYVITLYRKVLCAHLVALLGVMFVLTYVIIRAASFHHVDRLISLQFCGLKMNWVLEITGILFIIINSLHILSSRRKCEENKRDN